MIVRRLEELKGTSAEAVVADGQVSVVRYLLRDDEAGFSVSDVEVPAGTGPLLNYKNHVEANLILEGEGRVENLVTGEIHELRPGTIYVVYPPDKHRVHADTPLRIISIFNPPLVGGENHDDQGSYPAAPIGF